MNAQPLQNARIALQHFVLYGIACITLNGAMPSFGTASELESIMAGLETDCVSTADKLLLLGDETRRDPQFVRSVVQAARRVGREGHWEKSISLLQRARLAHQSAHQSTDARAQIYDEKSIAFLHTIDLAIASAAIQCQTFDLAIDHCQAVIKDTQASAQHRTAAIPLMIKALQADEQWDAAAEVLHQAVSDETGQLAAAQLAELAVSLGSACLEQKHPAAASLAYQDYLQLFPDGPRAPDAMLGAAWASALGADTSDQASVKLAAFISKHPNHPDAPHALRAMATCLERANRVDQAEAARTQLLDSYPRSDAAGAILSRYTKENSPWPAQVRVAWQARLKSTDGVVSPISIDQAHAVFMNALESGDDPLWQLATRWLIETDRDGAISSDLLTRFTSENQESAAEHLAVDLISQSSGATIGSPHQSSAASESACRWAGASERWTMLALAADELGPPDPNSTNENAYRSVAVDQMLAEALVQTQRPADSMPWWDFLIDQRGVDDFATLLRGAETSVAHGDIEIATTRVAAAKTAAGDVAFNRSLTNILAAELSIRRSRFDEARDALNEIVRAADPSPTLRPRAQWLVGETYFLQQRFPDAIDAYRRVDAMDSAGEWAPAALLQAGKAFEKLGRGRDAAVCYTALLTRFRDWPHASIAQTRLATLKPPGSSDSPASILR